MPNLCLISTPWPIYKRPSLQLGALKAYLKRELGPVEVHLRHLYLEVASTIGYETYDAISNTTWLGEALYAPLVFGQQYAPAQALWSKYARRINKLRNLDFFDLTKALEVIGQRHMEAIAQDSYLLIGASICFSQLTSSLYYLKELKKRCPQTITVIGGSHCSGPLGKTLLNTFDFIDVVIQGEGELPLSSLAKQLLEGRSLSQLGLIPGVSTRNHLSSNDLWQVDDLDQLPCPSYDDYFRELELLPPQMRFFPRLPIEGSRGCWYRKRAGGLKGCAFCNLNLQWQGYRSKDPQKICHEIEELISKYSQLSFSFMDNLIPTKMRQVFKRLASLDTQLRFFCEIRAEEDKDTLKDMARAGVEDVQVGIEALSTSLLRKMNKGTRAIQNIQIMKYLEIPGMPTLNSNLIMEFPSSDENDVQETLESMDFVRHLRPLKPIPFWLGYGSHVYFHFKDYGIKKVFNHPHYRFIFPGHILNGLILMNQGYLPRRLQKLLWKPVYQKAKEWEKTYKALKATMERDHPLLGYWDGKDFLLIRERLAKGKDLMHRLRGRSREIYLFCEEIRELREISQRFSDISEDSLLRFLREMVQKRLMYQEGECYLSLAVPNRPKNYS